jgi:hypothetical protein
MKQGKNQQVDPQPLRIETLNPPSAEQSRDRNKPLPHEVAVMLCGYDHASGSMTGAWRKE